MDRRTAPLSAGEPLQAPLSRRAFLRAGAALTLPVLTGCGTASARTNAGERRQAVVLGAGLAGLAAADALVKAGVDTLVLEARGRAGGRVHTLRTPFDDGLYAEAGAVFVPEQHARTLGLVRELGLELRPADAGRGTGTRLFVRGTLVTLREGEPPRWPVPLRPDEAALTQQELLARYLAPVAEGIGDPDHPLWPSPAALRLDRMTTGQLLRERGASEGAVSLMRLGYLDEWGDGIDAVSALGTLRDVAANRYGGAMYRIAGGSDRLPAALAARLGSIVRYGSPVTSLQQERRGVRIHYRGADRMHTVHADRVICAIPFPVLRTLSIRPAFSGGKRAAVAGLALTSITRVYLQVRRRAWDDAREVATDLPVQLVTHATEGQSGDRGIVEAFVAGTAARRLASMDPAACIRHVRRQIARIHPRLDEHVERATIHAWDDEPWSGGDYAWFRPGEVRAFLPHLASPEGRVHFAGDHTSARPGWMQGALDSGARAADEVLAALAGDGARRAEPRAAA
jgi:monoamine oxidase